MMPSKLVRGDDGKTYMEFPNGKRVEVEAPSQPRGPSQSIRSLMQPGGRLANPASHDPVTPQGKAEFDRSFAEEKASKRMTPEGLAMLLSPLTGGASIAAPAAISGGASILDDMLKGERDPYGIASRGLLHTGAGALPGIVGRVREAMAGGVPVTERLTQALDAGGSGRTWLGSGMKAASRFLKGPVDASGAPMQAPSLSSKIGPGGVQARAVPIIKGRTLAEQIRAAIAALSGVADQKYEPR